MTLAIYLSGPMRGRPDCRARFEEAAARLRRLGYLVWSPLEHDAVLGIEPGAELTEAQLQKAMAWDQRKVLDADLVVFLTGWRASKGCRAEFLVAWYAGKPLYQYAGGGRLWAMPKFHEPTVNLFPVDTDLRYAWTREDVLSGVTCL